MASVPSTMRSLAVRKYGKPSTYEIVEMPVPEMKGPDDVLVKVHAGSISTGDTQIVDGAFKLFNSASRYVFAKWPIVTLPQVMTCLASLLRSESKVPA